MRVLALFLAILMIATPCTPLGAQTTTTKHQYLTLNADPQDPSFQCNAGVGEVVLPDKDVYDSGWGSGSGRKIAGWYPAYTAMCRNKVDHTLIAVMRCGNVPSDRDIVEGKVIVVQSALPPPIPNAPAPQQQAQPACPTSGCGSYSSSTTVNINFAEEQSQKEQPWQPSYEAPRPRCATGCKTGIVAIVVGVTLGLVFGLHHGGGNTTAGYAGTGGAQ